MKLIAATLIATTALIGVANADASMDAYQTCWSRAAVRVLDKSGVTDQMLDQATKIAGQNCAKQARAATERNGAKAVSLANEQMETELYRANPTGDE